MMNLRCWVSVIACFVSYTPNGCLNEHSRVLSSRGQYSTDYIGDSCHVDACFTTPSINHHASERAGNDGTDKDGASVESSRAGVEIEVGNI